MTVLDASALLAFLFHEPGHEHVARVIETSCISTVNLAEVIGRFVRDGHRADLVAQRIAATTLEIVPFSAREASLAAALLPLANPLGLALGDRACLALALAREAPALTADRAWSSLQIGVPIHLIR